MARALYKLTLSTIKGTFFAFLSQGCPCLYISVCMFLSFQLSSCGTQRVERGIEPVWFYTNTLWLHASCTPSVFTYFVRILRLPVCISSHSLEKSSVDLLSHPTLIHTLIPMEPPGHREGHSAAMCSSI